MKRLGYLIPFLFLFCFAGYAAADTKIGVINVHKVLKSAAEVKASKKKIVAEFKPRQTQLIAEEKELKNQLEKFKRNSTVMSASEKRAGQEKLIANRRKVERLQRDYQQDLSGAESKAMQAFFAKLKKVVDTYAKAKDIDLVLQKDSVPYSNKRVDITDDIIKRVS